MIFQDLIIKTENNLVFGMSGSTFCSETDINVVIVRESRKILF